jgi:hypothetical protein
MLGSPFSSIDNQAGETHTSLGVIEPLEDLTVITSRWWVRPLHIMLGSLVVAVGAWLAWDGMSLTLVALLAVVTGGFLSWQRLTIGGTWAWTSLLLGLESLSWPLMTMYQIRQSTAEPNDDQMGTILSAVVAGLLSAVFWISFSYGLFRRSGRSGSDQSGTALAPQPVAPGGHRHKKR